ncbi:hypothetical protein LAZ67_16000191 [Cordylochernes scorpioides]|uniref:SUEL-type lectin domain-containing protein n=1 Tax=Cordylochernes scorpioides TaxID=51811 RepID=A0ABY6LEK3_9ARAC|nr:hypothetical protein LAZ67_16000191 [Cordylochernes scorpioides]
MFGRCLWNYLGENDALMYQKILICCSFAGKFFHKFACEGDKLRLRCPKDFRIVIYSATFGASPAGSSQCPQATSPTECQASYVTESVIKECHGRRKCSLTVDLATLGDTGCDVAVKPFLKVIYTCVPQDTLKEQETSEEEDVEENRVEMVVAPHYSGITEADDEEATVAAPTVTAPEIVGILDSQQQPVEVNCTQVMESQAAGFLAEWISAYAFVKAPVVCSGNKEQFFLYLTLSLTTGFLIFLAVLSARLYCQRRRSGHRTISECVVNLEQDVEGLSFTRATPTLRRSQQPSSPRTAHSNSYYS